MAKLPSFQDLGAVPNMGGSPGVGHFDATPIAKGAEAIGESIAQGGRSLGQGLSNLGAGVGKLGESTAGLEIDKARYQYAQAHADFLSRRIDLDAKFSQDQDYTTLPDRYRAELDEMRGKAAQTIELGPMQDRFLSDTQPDFHKSIAAAGHRAIELEGNANVAYVTQQGEKFIDQATATSDPDTRSQIIATHSALVDGLQQRGFATPMQALTMKQQWAHRYAIADGVARADTDPVGVINDLRAAPGSDDAIVNRIIQTERGGRAGARNPMSSAMGDGQFIERTWLDLIKRNRPDLAKDQSDQDILAMRADPKLSREMVGVSLNENRASLKSQGVPTTPGALYLAHFLGPGAAAAVLKADPNVPVFKALSAAVGPEKAAAMIQANPGVLAGRQAGTVSEWADKQMGGASAGGVHIYDYLEPAQRAVLLTHATQALNKQQTSDDSALRSRVKDTLAEAMINGLAQKPVSQAEFIAVHGVEEGQKAFQNYQAELKLGADVNRLAGMSPDDQQKLFDEYTPAAGSEGFADAAKRQAELVKAANQVNGEKARDPAAFAIARLPAAQAAWSKLEATIGSSEAKDADKAAAARDFAQQTLIEQGRVGVPLTAQRITPKEYGAHLAAQWNNPAAAGGPGQVLQRVEGEAKLWGDSWPQVYREIAPKLDPTVRVIAAGVEPAAGKALIENFHADEQKILGTQYATKKDAVEHAVTDAIAPIAKTFVGTEADQARRDYQAVASKLTAIYVSRGADAQTAAKQAVSEIVGSKYDLGDTYRVPHDAKVSGDQVAAGIDAARSLMTTGPRFDTSLEDAKRDLNLTPQEEALYQRHLKNLSGPGGVDNPDGTRSTLYQMSFERDGKIYNIPTVWDGQILKPDDAVKRAEREGIEKFPSYANEDEAEARYGKMHDYMEKDTGRFLRGRLDLATERDNFGGLTPGYLRTATMSALARDGQWVTAPDEKGLMLVYKDQVWPRASDPTKPFMLTWEELHALGAGGKAAAASDANINNTP